MNNSYITDNTFNGSNTNGMLIDRQDYWTSDNHPTKNLLISDNIIDIEGNDTGIYLDDYYTNEGYGDRATLTVSNNVINAYKALKKSLDIFAITPTSYLLRQRSIFSPEI